MFIQYKISLSLGSDILKIKQVTVKRPTLNKQGKQVLEVFLVRPKIAEQVSMENHLEENFKKFQIPSLGKHVGVKFYLKSVS